MSKTDIRIPVRSDHKAIDLQLRFGDEKRRGPGTWKFNNTLLEDEEYWKKSVKNITILSQNNIYI